MRWSTLVLAIGLSLSASTVWGQTRDDLPDLLKQLGDPEALNRMRALKQIGRIGLGAHEALPQLAHYAANDPDLDVRAVARNAIAAVQAAGIKELTASTLESIKILKKAPTGAERTKALEDIAALGPDAREASSDLLEVMSQVSGSPQPFLDVLAKINPELHKPLLPIVLEKDNAKRTQAMDELQRMGPDAEPAFAVLLGLYKADRAATKEPAQSLCPKLLQTMSKVAPHHKAFGPLVQEVLTSSNPNDKVARAVAIEAGLAADLDPKKFVAFLTQSLNDPPIRAKAAEALGKMGPAAHGSLSTLSAYKNSSDNAFREAVNKAIDEIKGASPK